MRQDIQVNKTELDLNITLPLTTYLAFYRSFNLLGNSISATVKWGYRHLPYSVNAVIRRDIIKHLAQDTK